MTRSLIATFDFRDEALELSGLSTVADPVYVPASVIAPFLGWLWSNGRFVEFAGVMLTLALALPREVLESMAVVDAGELLTNQPAGLTRAGDLAIDVQIRDRSGGVLTLRIPAWWLIGLPHDGRPFEAVWDQINAAARAFKIREGTVAPTWDRIRAASSRLMGSGLLSRLDREYLSGVVSNAAMPAAHYRHASVVLVRDRFRMGLERLQERLARHCTGSLLEQLRAPVPEQPRDEQWIEYVGHKSLQFTGLLNEIRGVADKHWSGVASALNPTEMARRALVGTRAALLYSFGLSAITLALRAPGDKTVYEPLDDRLIRIREKDSDFYLEQRIGRFTGVAKQQRDEVIAVVRWLIERNLIAAPQSMPVFPVLVESRGTWTLLPMSGTRFRSECKKLGSSAPPPAAMNVGRHICATLLYQRMPEMQVHEVLGIRIGAFGADSPYAITDAAVRQSAFDHIDAWLRSKGLTPVSAEFAK